MLGRKRRIQAATNAVRHGYDRALVDAGVVLFQQIAPGVDGHYVSSSIAAALGWDAGAFRETGTLRRLVHPDDLPLFRSVAPPDDGHDHRHDHGPDGPTSATIDLRGDPDLSNSSPATLPSAGPAPADAATDEPVVRFLTAAGDYRPMLVRMVRPRPGEPLRGTLIDVTAGEDRRQRARRLADVVEVSHHGFLLFELSDPDDPSSVVFRAANGAARSLFELDASVLDGGRLDAVFAGPSARLLQSALYDVAHTGEPLTAERLSFPEVPDTFVDLRIDRLVDGALGVTVDDITRTVEVEERLRHQASHDHLTGLPNRGALEDVLSLAAAALGPGEHRAVILVGIDGLDDLNRELGQRNGDRILTELARRLAEDVPGVDSVARIGGGEFVAVSAIHPDRDSALDRARMVRDALDRPLDVDGDLRHISCTLGAAIAPEHGLDPGTLLQAADGALRHARSSADPLAVFDPAEERTTMRRVGLLTELRRGLANQELELRYQPVVDLRTGRVTKVEALLHRQRVAHGTHLSAELLKSQYKFDMTPVPYRGIPPGMTDLLEGRLQVGLLPGPLAIQHVQAGKLRALAVLADKRLPTLPEVPTFSEAGFADAQVMSWYTIAVRAGTPAPIVERLHASATKALQSRETRDRLAKAGCDVPPPRTPTAVMTMWQADFARYGRLVKEAGIKAES